MGCGIVNNTSDDVLPVEAGYFTTTNSNVTVQSNGAPVPFDIYVGDTRATSLSVKCKDGNFSTGPSVERFSGHTGICRVLGSKKLPVVPHSLQLGDLLRVGSVGLVVCEVNRGSETENLSSDDLCQLKQNYLSSPLAKLCSLETSKSSEEETGVGDTSDEEETQEETGRFCYICYDDDQDQSTNPLVAPCECKGDTKYVHLNCLQRWNNNEEAENKPKVCAVTNTDGLDVCSICKATYQTSVSLDDGRKISLLAKKLEPPYVTFCVVTQHDVPPRSVALTNTRFQLSFASMLDSKECLTIGRATSNNMVLRYRTVSQMHAKVKFHQGQFYLMDSGSSNGTMIFLKQPLELPWGKAIHIKMGRTILSMKAKKKWKWTETS